MATLFLLERRDFLKIENPFNCKEMEKVLFDAYKAGALQGRKTRTFLRRMARHIEHSYEIGHRDGVEGRTMIQPEEVPTLHPDSPMMCGIQKRVYVAYASGYCAGAQERKGE